MTRASRCLTAPFETETEITGPVSATLFVSSSTTDADLFLVLRVFDPDGAEVVLQGAVDPHTPIGQGWLRASTASSTSSGPSHGGRGTPTTRSSRSRRASSVEVDVEIWPTSIVVPVGLPGRSQRPRHRL